MWHCFSWFHLDKPYIEQEMPLGTLILTSVIEPRLHAFFASGNTACINPIDEHFSWSTHEDAVHAIRMPVFDVHICCKQASLACNNVSLRKNNASSNHSPAIRNVVNICRRTTSHMSSPADFRIYCNFESHARNKASTRRNGRGDVEFVSKRNCFNYLWDGACCRKLCFCSNVPCFVFSKHIAHMQLSMRMKPSQRLAVTHMFKHAVKHVKILIADCEPAILNQNSKDEYLKHLLIFNEKCGCQNRSRQLFYIQPDYKVHTTGNIFKSMQSWSCRCPRRANTQ